MNKQDILIKPILSEKSNFLSENKGKYTFRVHKKANKLEIKKTIEEYYNVKVSEINTFIVPGKAKSRYTKSGFLNGIKSGFKKAVVTLEKDQTIDLYGEV